ncbi:MAG: T9SS type A sorting domain-containing protein [candidate division Zixibacteria bacterium]|nr:T9SS type A sorting domain-containing protein [candidate division Zixibacteria bacterium]
MKHFNSLAIMTAIIFSFASLSHSQIWVESSNGIIPPEMDGGHTELEFADINLDGHPDIVCIGDHGSPYVNTDQHGVMVWVGDGTGNWSVEMYGNFGYGGIAVGDVDIDGFLDVGYGMHHDWGSGGDLGDQLIEVALGNGTTSGWMPWDDGLATNGEDWGMFGTDFADIDADGYLDLVSVSFGAGSGIHVYRNNKDGSWTQNYGYNGGNSGMYVEFGDINNDGYPDIASTTGDSAIFINDGSGQYDVLVGGGITLPTYYGYEDIALGDVDNDGRDEVAISTSDDLIEVWSLNEDNQTWEELTHELSGYSGATMVDIADMNADGYLDIIAYGSGTAGIFLGDGGNSWTYLYSFNLPEPGRAQAFRAGTDFDHNGWGDIALVNEERESWIIYRNYTHVYKESSTPTQLTMTPVYPHGNEVILGGASGWIDWISAVPDGENTTVEIELSQSGEQGPFYTIASGLPNNGRYQLRWPDGINSTDCCLRLTVHGSYDVSATTPTTFEIRSEGASPVAVNMTPRGIPVVAAPGEQFKFTGGLINTTSIGGTGDVWTMVRDSNGSLFGPVSLFRGIELAPYQVVRIADIPQDVPVWAPEGDYQYVSYCGYYPSYIVDSAYFSFEVRGEPIGNSSAWKGAGWFKQTGDGLPSAVLAAGNYPNPFNASTTINFNIPDAGNVRVDLYNIRGQLVEALADEYMRAGNHSVVWDASGYASGVYFYRISSGEETVIRRMTLMK